MRRKPSGSHWVLLHDEEGRPTHWVDEGVLSSGRPWAETALPVRARVDTQSVARGEEIQVRLVSADAASGALRFERVR